MHIKPPRMVGIPNSLEQTEVEEYQMEKLVVSQRVLLSWEECQLNMGLSLIDKEERSALKL